MRAAELQNGSIGKVPLVSVIMIFLNEERFIGEAIKSVFAQGYSNWELLLVDDGSNDNSTDIAKKYAIEYQEKVRYLEHPCHANLGMSASHNLGIRDAKGESITFLDADDVWLPEKLQQQTAILAGHPEIDLVCSRAQWWYGWTGRAQDIERDFIQQFDVELDTIVKARELLLLFLQNEWASICDLLLRRDAVEAVGGYEPAFRDMYEDQAFHAKVCLRSTAFVTSKCWYRYRQHPNACTARHRGGYRVKRLIFLQWLKQYLSGQGGTNTEVWNVVEKELGLLRHPLLSRLSAFVRCN